MFDTFVSFVDVKRQRSGQFTLDLIEGGPP